MAFTLGTFTFNDSQFGNTLLESDGGAWSAGNWLNTTNADPGNPAYLTGNNVETGVANIGLGGPVSYTIGYSTPIVNAASADDIGVIVGRYSFDSFDMEVSEDGVNFSPVMTIGVGSAVYSGENRTYFYNGAGPFTAELWVHSLDLSAFGVGVGNSVKAVRITGYTELDLIRAAGLVPEPSVFVGIAGAAGFLFSRRRRK